MNIKSGKHQSETELRIFLDGSERLLTSIKDVYKNKTEDLVIKEWLYKTVKWEVEEKIFMELQ